MSPAPPLPERLAFADDFLWGAATAAYQVEGGIVNDWSAAGFDAGICMDHYHRYAEDFAHARTMGHTAHRFSLEWARIQPQPGQWNQAAIAHYRRVLEELRAQGLRPFVTLWHFTLPDWFAAKGGWLRAENIQDFVAYVRFVGQELGDLADDWITLNEPLVYTFQSYDEGRWPPFGHDRNQALTVARHLLLAHARAYDALHALRPGLRVGLVKNMTMMDPQLPWHPLSRWLTRLQDRLFNEAIWEALCTGELQLRLPGCAPLSVTQRDQVKGRLDFLGINYYTRYLVSPTAKLITRPGAPLTDLGWEIYPEGFSRALLQATPFARELGVPIYVTENGLADAADAQREAFLVQHLGALWQAIAAGAPVAGYFHWSLIDNFEWADGFGYRFGLLDGDRHWRASAHLYRQIITDRGFERAWLTRYPIGPQPHPVAPDSHRV